MNIIQINSQRFLIDFNLLKGQFDIFGGEQKKIQKPGSRGGKFWIDDKGNVRYDERPTGISKKKMLSEKEQQLLAEIKKKKETIRPLSRTSESAVQGKEKEPWEMTREELKRYIEDQVFDEKSKFNKARDEFDNFIESIVKGKKYERGGLIESKEYTLELPYQGQKLFFNPKDFTMDQLEKVEKHKKIIDSILEKYHLGDHKKYIQQALSEGKQVPQKVLDDYPELKAKTKEPEKVEQKKIVTDPKQVHQLIIETTPENRNEVTKSLFGYDEKKAEIEREKKRDYKFEPRKPTWTNYKGDLLYTLDYTEVIPKNIELINEKDIINKEKPSWIPDVDERFFERCSFSTPFLRLEKNKYMILTGSKSAAIVNLDVLAATWDYYLKRAKASRKKDAEEKSERYGRKYKAKSVRTIQPGRMSWSQYYLIEDYIGKERSKIWEHYRTQYNELRQKMDDMEIQVDENMSTYAKGRETSYGRKGTNDRLLKSHGVVVKRQNGDKISEPEIDQIEKALTDVYQVFGDRTQMSKKYDLLISHSGNVMMHARQAVGIFFPFYHAIGVSMSSGEKGFGFTLSHEFGHFMDYWLGTIKGSHTYSSDNPSGISNEIARTFRANMKKYQKSKYQNRTCECFARALEQYYSVKKGEHEDFQKKTNAAGNHPDHETYMAKVYPLVDKFFKENNEMLKSILKKMLVQLNGQRFLIDFNLLKGQFDIFGGEQKKIQKPGSRGGKFWIDDKGNVRYDERPTGASRKKLQAEKEQRLLAEIKAKKEGEKVVSEKEKEPWQMNRKDAEKYFDKKERDLLEKWEKAGSKGFPPSTKPTIGEVAKRAEKVGLLKEVQDMVEGKSYMPYHKLVVAEALSEGKPVPEEVLKDYPDLQKKEAKEKAEKGKEQSVKVGDRIINKPSGGMATVQAVKPSGSIVVKQDVDGRTGVLKSGEFEKVKSLPPKSFNSIDDLNAWYTKLDKQGQAEQKDFYQQQFDKIIKQGIEELSATVEKENIDYLKELGYDQRAIDRMSARTKTEIVDNHLTADKVSVLTDGGYKVIEKVDSEKGKVKREGEKEPWKMTTKEYRMFERPDNSRLSTYEEIIQGYKNQKRNDLVEKVERQADRFHEAEIEHALKNNKLTLKQAEELGHFEKYPDLAEKFKKKKEGSEKTGVETEKLQLHKKRLVKIDEDVRGAKDRRYKVDKHIYEYEDENGDIYRKAFVVKRGETPNIPEKGTHDELNELREQHQVKKSITGMVINLTKLYESQHCS